MSKFSKIKYTFSKIMLFFCKGLGSNRQAKKRESSTCPIWVKLGSAVQGFTLKL